MKQFLIDMAIVILIFAAGIGVLMLFEATPGAGGANNGTSRSSDKSPCLIGTQVSIDPHCDLVDSRERPAPV